eukprot:5169467-Prymnesium_polylepis.1
MARWAGISLSCQKEACAVRGAVGVCVCEHTRVCGLFGSARGGAARTCIDLLRGAGAASSSMGSTAAIAQIGSAESTFSANSGSANRAMRSSRKYRSSSAVAVRRARLALPVTRTSATAILG